MLGYLLPLLQGLISHKCIGLLRKNYSQPFCPPAEEIPKLLPIPPVDPQPTYPYDTCMEFYNDLPWARRALVADVADWCRGGNYFSFQSGAGHNMEVSGGRVRMWWRCDGPRGAPQVLFVHGYPTSSWDTWKGTSELLKKDHYVCHVDHQGMGFSDKPQAPYYYSIYEHAAALNEFVTRVANLTAFHLVTHDMGDSIGFAFLEKFVNPATAIQKPSFRLTHHTITNGNVWLPLASLKTSQLLLLDNQTSSVFLKELSCLPPSLFSLGIVSLYREHHAMLKEEAALTSVFEYRDGVQNQNDLDQYLQQRACFEKDWFAALNASLVPATLVWGQKDPVAGPKVGDYVWNTSLSVRPSPARYIKVPDGGHYVCHDKPELFACLIRDPHGNCSFQGGFQSGITHSTSSKLGVHNLADIVV